MRANLKPARVEEQVCCPQEVQGKYTNNFLMRQSTCTIVHQWDWREQFQISTYSRVSNYGGTTSNGVRREHAWLWNQVHGWPHRQVTWPLHCLCAEDGPRGGAHVFRNQRLLYMNWTGSHVAIEVMMIAKNHEIWYIVFTYLTCLATSQCVLFQEFHNGIPSTSQILDIDT